MSFKITPTGPIIFNTFVQLPFPKYLVLSVPKSIDQVVSCPFSLLALSFGFLSLLNQSFFPASKNKLLLSLLKLSLYLRVLGL